MTPGQGGPHGRISTPHHSPQAAAGIGATLTPAETTRRTWDAVIVGAGPAGSATALRLARAGWQTLLLDRGTMPRGKVCGCCLSTAAIAELRRLSGDPGHESGTHASRQVALLPASAIPLEDVRFAAGGRVARMPFPGGTVVSREALDAELVRAAIDAGCHWVPRCDVDAVDESPDTSQRSPLAVSVRVGADAGAGAHAAPMARLVIDCRLLVLAAGLADRVRLTSQHAVAPTFRRGRVVAPRSRIGIGAVLPPDAAGLPPGELVMAVAPRGYCGLVRLDDGRIDVAAAVDPSTVADGTRPAAAILRILDTALGADAAAWLDRDAFAADHFRATPPLTHRSPLVAGGTGRVFRVGDAAGYVEPFTGEGIGWALAGARLLATALIDAASPHDSRAAAAAYRTAHAGHFASRHARCGRVARGLRVPPLVAGAMHAARLAPWAARRAVPLLVGHDRIATRPREGSLPS